MTENEGMKKPDRSFWVCVCVGGGAAFWSQAAFEFQDRDGLSFEVITGICSAKWRSISGIVGGSKRR